MHGDRGAVVGVLLTLDAVTVAVPVSVPLMAGVTTTATVPVPPLARLPARAGAGGRVLGRVGYRV